MYFKYLLILLSPLEIRIIVSLDPPHAILVEVLRADEISLRGMGLYVEHDLFFPEFPHPVLALLALPGEYQDATKLDHG